MAYRQPGVKVTQDFTGVTPALTLFNLPNVNVGPAFQVVDKGEAGSYTGDEALYPFPGQIEGTYVDTRESDPTDLINYPIRIFLKDATLEYLTAATGNVDSSNLNEFTDATTDIFADVVAGDVLVVTGSGSGNDGAYTVRQVVDVNTIKTNETFTATEATLDYTIRRNIQSTVGTVEVASDTSGIVIDQTDGVTLPVSLTYTDDTLGEQPVVSATVLLSYRAQRIELSADVAELKSTNEIKAAFGIDQIVPENPLAFAAYLALNNRAQATNVLALDSGYLEDELVSYSSAFDILKNTDMYAINILTQATAVHTILNSHVLAMSEPEQKLERVGIVNRKLVTTATVVDEITTVSEGITGSSGGPYTTLNSSESFFLTDGVVPGMYANVTAPSGAVGRYKIGAVVSQTKLTLSSGADAVYDNITFSIDKNLSLSQQASTLSAYASSIGSRRLVMTWPDVVKIPVGSDVRELPGYFLGCSVAALTTALPTQQGLTNMPVALYTGVVHSTKYFDNDQMNTIANGGVMIFVQNVLDVTALYIRHQLTTDRSAIKFQEYSITKNVDFIAKFIRTAHADFPGKYNIVDGAFDDLKTNAQGIVGFLRDDTKRPKIGGVIKSGKLTSVIQDPSNIDTILEQWSLDIPIPLNNLDITIFV